MENIARHPTVYGPLALLACACVALVGMAGCTTFTTPAAQSASAARTIQHDYRTKLVLLGTAGGRTSWNGTKLGGISSAIEVDGDVYLVDFGEGWQRHFLQAGLGGKHPGGGLAALRAAFITHLHADQVVGYPGLFMFGTSDGLSTRRSPVRIFGPGSRGSMVPMEGRQAAVAVVSPQDPTPGTVRMTESIYSAFAIDINDNIRDSQKPDPRSLVQVEDIRLPAGVVVDENRNPAPEMPPFLVYQDDKVKVTATLVSHPPVYPSFAYRFDTADGSIVFSGDTSPSANLIRLADKADVLVHEVIDTRWVDELLPMPRNASQAAKAHHLLHSHTTIEEVGAVAQAAKAKTLVLSHLAPADGNPARWSKAQQGFSGSLVVGQDLMWIGVGSRH